MNEDQESLDEETEKALIAIRATLQHCKEKQVLARPILNALLDGILAILAADGMDLHLAQASILVASEQLWKERQKTGAELLDHGVN